MMNKKKVLDEYMIFRGLTNKTENGLRDIRFHINKFLLHTQKPLDKFDEPLLTAYVKDINEKYKTTMSNTVKSSYLKNFIKWNFPDWSMRFRNLDKICKTEKADETYSSEDMLSEEDVQRVIQDEETNFWKAYFLTLFYGSCRPVEVVNLTKKQIEFDNDGWAFIDIHSKKNKRKFLKAIPSEAAFYLKKLCSSHDFDDVFANKRTGKKITVKGAYWKLNQMTQKTLGKKVNLYKLRHSIATINYDKCGDNGIEEKDVANQMGHSKSMRATYEHKNRDKLKERAKRIYFDPKELPEEKKHELQLQVEALSKELKESTQIMKETYEEREREKKELEKIKKMMTTLSSSFSEKLEKLEKLKPSS